MSDTGMLGEVRGCSGNAAAVGCCREVWRRPRAAGASTARRRRVHGAPQARNFFFLNNRGMRLRKKTKRERAARRTPRGEEAR